MINVSNPIHFCGIQHVRVSVRVHSAVVGTGTNLQTAKWTPFRDTVKAQHVLDMQSKSFCYGGATTAAACT